MGKMVWGRIFVFLLLLVCVVQTSSAFGISPAKYTKFFDPGKAYIYSFWVVNQDNQNISVDISVEGELSQYITLLNESIELRENETFKRAYFKIIYPESIGVPGQHTVSIVFTDSRGVDNRGGEITVVPVVKAVFEVFVPYPGKYLEYNMSIESANSRQPVKIIFPLSNKGSGDFESVYADVEVLGVMKKTETISVGQKKQAQLKVEFDSLVPGSYNAKAVLHYDDESAEFEKEFDYGEWIISIQDIRVEEFTIGDFADFDIVLKNNWNMDAEDVISDLIITDMAGYKYTSVTSFSTIPAQGSAHFSGYWDSYNATPGEYYLTLRIYYANLTKQYSPKITVEKRRIVTQYYAPPEDVVVSFFDDYGELIKNIGYFVLGLVLLVGFFFILVRSLTLVERVVGKVSLKKKPVIEKVRVRKVRYKWLADLVGYVANLDFIDYLMRKKRIRRLQMLKKRYVRAIKSAREDLLTMRRAIDGLYYNLEKGVVNENEFDKRLLKILGGKSLEYWEDYYVRHIIRLEGKIKQVNKLIWEEG